MKIRMAVISVFIMLMIVGSHNSIQRNGQPIGIIYVPDRIRSGSRMQNWESLSIGG
jgi:hypothetical protein